MKQTRDQYAGIGILLTATLIYGFFGVLSRIIGYSIPLFYQTGLRAVLTSILVGLIVYFSHSWRPVKPVHWGWIVLRSIAGMIGMVGFFIAVNALPIGTVYFIFYAGSTIGGYIIGSLLFKESITPVKMISLILSIAGLYCIYSFTMNPDKLLYGSISLAAGLGTAAWNTLSKKFPVSYPPTQLAFLDNAIGAFLALIVSLFIGEQWVIPTATVPWITNAVFALLCVATGQLIIAGFRKLDAQIGSLVMLTEVLFGILLGYLLYHELITASASIGGLLIISAIVIGELLHIPSRSS